MSLVDPSRVEELLERIKSVRLLVVGDLMLDRYLVGTVERISPEAPVPVVRVQSERTALGGAGNVAANATALGASCAVVGHVGHDAEGATLLDALEEAGVDARGVVRSRDRPTTVKTRVLAKHQQIVRVDREADDDAGPELGVALRRAVEEASSACDAIVVQDYDKGVLTTCVIDSVREVVARRRLPWVVDPKRRRFFAYAGATLFKPNAKELQDALGEPIHPDDSVWMESVRCRLACDHLLVTLGDRGMVLRASDGSHRRLPAVARAVYDVSGAGDTVTATLAVCLAAGADVAEAAALANRAAALEVAKIGVQTVSAAELLAHMQRAVDQRGEPLEEIVG